jgi:hypothetical protein
LIDFCVKIVNRNDWTQLKFEIVDCKISAVEKKSCS